VPYLYADAIRALQVHGETLEERGLYLQDRAADTTDDVMVGRSRALPPRQLITQQRDSRGQAMRLELL